MVKKRKKIDYLLLVGAGYMAREYAKVLKALKVKFIVVGNRKNSAKSFEKSMNVQVEPGGIEKWLKKQKKSPKRAIVATTEDTLGKITISLIKAGVREVLVEKPGAFLFSEIKIINKLADSFNSRVYVGYNRRFYASLQKAKQIIKRDGGTTSIFFDFTELGWKIKTLKIKQRVKEQWYFHNSTHVIDMAFFITGFPKKMYSLVTGKLPWHPNGVVFVGSGLTKNGTLFTYHANWGSPGRWGVEIMTRKNKLILRPLEKLFIQKLGSFEQKEVVLNDKKDLDFKPGLFLQVKAFLGNKENLCSILEQTKNVKIYSQILGK